MTSRDNARLSAALKIIVIVVLILTIIIGCTSQQAVSPTPSQENGTIVSKELVEVAGQNPKIHIYKIFYISQGSKVEAFLSEPIDSGKYPLHVSLHGGFAYEMPNKTHEPYNGVQAEALKDAPENMVRIAPQYRGYMGSEGSIQGLAGNTADTQNAIKAAMSWGNVMPDSIYLTGTSMGGGVALRTASERKDVKAVVAVSPFVGWDTIISWMDNHPNENSDYIMTKERDLAKFWNKYFKDHPDSERENSLLDRVTDIQAPVLFLQGTGDDRVVWHTVQAFSERMKEKNKNVKLILYPGGAHGLKDRYQKEANKEIASWLTEYGLFQKPRNPQ